MTQPLTKAAPLTETPEYTADELIKQHGRVTAKKMLRDREPKVSVLIQPSEEDIVWAQAHDGVYPDVVMTCDGTRYPIKVGDENSLPQSVWEAYRTSKQMARVKVPGVFTVPMGGELPSPR